MESWLFCVFPDAPGALSPLTLNVTLPLIADQPRTCACTLGLSPGVVLPLFQQPLVSVAVHARTRIHYAQLTLQHF